MTSVAFAGESAIFYNEDRNYPLVLDNSRTAWFLDKNSIKINVNDPPFFIITVQVATANGVETCEFFFDEGEPDMRIFVELPTA